MKKIREILRTGPLGKLSRRAKSTRTGVRLGLGYGMKPSGSVAWNTKRGLPVHRYYLEEFLCNNADAIQGQCLEFQEDSYATRFGGGKVERLEILHHDDTNPEATIVADLTKKNQIPDNTFDCIICTYVLHMVQDIDAIIQDMKRILKPGGVLLSNVPFILRYTHESSDLWRFTPESVRMKMDPVFGEGNTEYVPYGSSLTAAGDLRGLAAEDFSTAELNAVDDAFPLLIATCSRKQ